MKKHKSSRLVAVAYSGLIISILSACTTIVGYTNHAGVHRTFSLFDFLTDAQSFGTFVLNEFTGTGYVLYRPWEAFVLIALGVIAIVCAFVGLVRLSRQTENLASFVLTIIGLVGTAAPSITILISIVALRNKYLGTITCGIYPIVSPLAMIACIAAVAEMRKRNVEFRKKLRDADGLIFRGGDL